MTRGNYATSGGQNIFSNGQRAMICIIQEPRKGKAKQERKIERKKKEKKDKKIKKIRIKNWKKLIVKLLL